MNSTRHGMTLLMLAFFVVMVGIATQYPPKARFMPFVVGIPGIVLCLLQLYLDVRDASRTRAKAEADAAPADTIRREIVLWGYFLGLIAGVLLFGFWVAIPVFILSFLRFWARASRVFSLGLTTAVTVVFYLAFVKGLGVILHAGFVTEYLLDRLAR